MCHFVEQLELANTSATTETSNHTGADLYTTRLMSKVTNMHCAHHRQHSTVLAGLVMQHKAQACLLKGGHCIPLVPACAAVDSDIIDHPWTEQQAAC